MNLHTLKHASELLVTCYQAIPEMTAICQIGNVLTRGITFSNHYSKNTWMSPI